MSEITNFRGDVVSDGAVEGVTDEAFIALVGDRVRKARERKGITRKRLLSELSQVSQRYLAQLEGGEGNISIALLHRVAAALDRRIEWLVCEEDPVVVGGGPDRLALQRSHYAATPARAARSLSPDQPSRLKAAHLPDWIARGRQIDARADARRKPRHPVHRAGNRDIEEQSGMPVNEVMALYGQEGYRRLERQALERIVAMTDCVVLAVAGGIVSEPETYNFLLRNFHTIWLKATPEEHMQRVRTQGDERPMAGNSLRRWRN